MRVFVFPSSDSSGEQKSVFCSTGLSGSFSCIVPPFQLIPLKTPSQSVLFLGELNHPVAKCECFKVRILFKKVVNVGKTTAAD